jgi:hypothetical protein
MKNSYTAAAQAMASIAITPPVITASISVMSVRNLATALRLNKSLRISKGVKKERCYQGKDFAEVSSERHVVFLYPF